jgi:hypothetical protein
MSFAVSAMHIYLSKSTSQFNGSPGWQGYREKFRVGLHIVMGDTMSRGFYSENFILDYARIHLIIMLRSLQLSDIMVQISQKEGKCDARSW